MYEPFFEKLQSFLFKDLPWLIGILLAMLYGFALGLLLGVPLYLFTMVVL